MKNKDVTIDVLMGTWNGEAFLEAQIESIRNQSHQSWKLLIRDDNSNDRTDEIIDHFVKIDSRISRIETSRENLGAPQNFGVLMSHSLAPYFMFADQDDVWLPKKMEILLEQIQAMEKKHPGIPLIVHSDSMFTNQSLRPLGKLFLGSRGNRHGLHNLLFTGLVQGASLIANHQLLEMALPFPENVGMHDHYLSMICEVFGKRLFYPQSLMYYRIHERNVLGKSDDTFSCRFKKAFTGAFCITGEREIATTQAYLHHFGRQLGRNHIRCINDFFYIANTNNPLCSQVMKIIRNRFKGERGMGELIVKIALRHLLCK